MTTIKQRRGTAAQWTSANPVLAAGEPGFETDTGNHKIGDGATAWNSLLPANHATYDAGATTVLYVDPAGSDTNSGLIQSLPKQTIAAAITALGGGLGEVKLKKNATFTIAAGLTWDVAKVRVVGKRTTIDASSMTTGTAVALTSSVLNTTGSYDHRSNRPPLQGVKIKGSGRTNTVTALSLAGGTNELAHMRAAWDVTITGFGTGISLGTGVHNVELGVDCYECGRCIDDSAAASNAGERIVFSGGAFFNSTLVGYLHNGTADYAFVGCSFDYMGQVFNINGPVVTCVGCHTEGNDANFGSNNAFSVAVGSLNYYGGVVTGVTASIPGCVKVTDAAGKVAFRDVQYNWSAPFRDPASVGYIFREDPQVRNRQFVKTTSSTPGSATNNAVYEVPMDGVLAGSETAMRVGNTVKALETGYYLVGWGVDMSASAAGTARYAWLALNGADTIRYAYKADQPGSNPWRVGETDFVFLNAGDTLALHIFQDSGGALAINVNGDLPYISMIRVV